MKKVYHNPCIGSVQNNTVGHKGIVGLLALRLSFLLLFALISAVAWGQKTWDGGAGTSNWGDGNNWNPDGVPAINDDVVISNNAGLSVIVNGAYSCKSLAVNYTGNTNGTIQVSIPTGRSLDVTNSVTGSNSGNGGENVEIDVNGGVLTCNSINFSNTAGNTRDIYLKISNSASVVNVAGGITLSGANNETYLYFTENGQINVGGTISGGAITSTLGGGATAATTGTINYNTTAQNVGAYTYFNLTLSGSGVKTFGTTTVNGTLSLEGTATTAGGAVTLGASSTLQYKGTVPQTTNVEFPATAYNVVIDNANGVSMVGNHTIGTQLLLTNGAFNIGANTLTLNGVIPVCGNLVGGATSNLTITTASANTFLPGITLNNLILSRANGITLCGHVNVKGTFTLTNGIVTLGDYNLTIEPGATISATGASSATRFVAVTGTGRLIKQSTMASEFNMTYPVGINGVPNWVVVSAMNAAVTNPGSLSVRAIDGRAANTLSTDLDKHWVIETSNISLTSTNLSFAYVDPDDVNGNPGAYVLKYSPTNPATTWSNPVSPSAAGANPLITTNSTVLAGTWTAKENSTTYYAMTSGNWNDATIWTLDPAGALYDNPTSHYPNAADESAVIKNGREVVLNFNTLNCAVLTVDGSLDAGSTTGHTVGSIRGGGRILLSGDNWFGKNTDAFVLNSTSGRGTVVYYGSTRNLTTTATKSIYYNLDIAPTAGQTITLMNDQTLTVYGNLQVSSGKLRIHDDSTDRRRAINITGDLLVEANAEIGVGTWKVGSDTGGGTTVTPAGQYHQLTISGNLINNGTAKFTNLTDVRRNQWDNSGAVEVIMGGNLLDKRIECNGPTVFNMLTCNKANAARVVTVTATTVDNFKLYGKTDGEYLTGDLALGGDLDAKKALRLLRGTFKLGSNIVIASLTYDSDFIVDTDCSLWLADGANVSVINNNTNNTATIVYGTLKLTGAGTSFVNNTDYGLILRNKGTFRVEDGTATLDNFRTSTLGDPGDHVGAYYQSGGIVNIVDEGVENYYAPFHLPYANNTFTMTGGLLNIRSVESSNGGAARYFAMVLGCGEGKYNVTGGEVVIDMVESSNARMTSTVPFWDFTVKNSNATNRTLSINGFVSGGIIDDTPAMPLVVLNNFKLQTGTNRPTFDANGQNVLVGGNFTVETSCTYNANGNTTIFNGAKNSLINNANATAIAFNGLTLAKEIHPTTGSYYEVGLSGTGSFSVAGNLTLNRGQLATTTYSPTVAGNIEIVDGHITNTTGVIELNRTSGTNDYTTAQTLKGALGVEQEFGAIRLNNGNRGFTLLSDVNLTSLAFAGSGSAKGNLGSYNLTVHNNITNYNTSRWLYTAGAASNGGLSLKVTANGSYVFPVGMSNKYTPNTMVVSNYTSDGYVTCTPVNSALQTTNQAGGVIMPYYWKMQHNGFATLPNVTYVFTYAETDNAGYYPGKVLDENPYTRSYIDDVNKVVEAPTKTILFDTPFLVEKANYTAGAANRFTGTVRVFYSRDVAQQANWRADGAWTRNDLIDTDMGVHDSRQPSAGTSYPTTGDVAVIGWIPWTDLGRDPSLRGMPHGIWADNQTESCAELIFTPMTDSNGLPVARKYRSTFQFRPTLCINETGQLNAGMVRGEGMFWNRYSDPNFALMDIGDFAAQDSSYVVYESTGSTLANTAVLFPNLMVASDDWGRNDKNVTFSKNIETRGNFEIVGNTNLVLSITATGNITVGKDLNIIESYGTGGGSLVYGNSGTDRTVTVNGDLYVNNSGGRIYVDSPNTTIDDHSLHVYGNISVSTTVAGGGLDLWTANNQDRVTLNLKGNNDMDFNHVSGDIPELYRLVVDKGTSTSTQVHLNGDFNLNGPTSGVGIPKALELTNGLLVVNNNDLSLPLTTGDDYFVIPATSGIEVQNGELVVNGTSGIELAGLLHVNGGTLNMSGGANDISVSPAGGSLTISGGTATIGGQVRRSTTSEIGPLKYTQTGGTLVVGASACDDTDRGVFEVVGTGSSLSVSGGNFYVARSSSASFPALYLSPASTSISTSSVIHIGHASVGGQIIGIDATPTLQGLNVINGNTAQLMVRPLTINGNLNIEALSTLNADGYDLNVGGDFNSPGSFVANGNTTTFSGDVAQLITGAIHFYNLTKNGTAALSLAASPNAPIVVDGKLSLNSGTFNDNGNTVTLLGNLNLGATHVYGGSGNGLYLNGTSVQHLTGSGVAGMMTINNANGAIVDQGNYLTISDKLRLESGVLAIGKNLLTLSSNCAIEAGLPFSNTNMIQTNASFTDGGVKKMFVSGAQTFLFPIGAGVRYTPVTFTATSLTSTTGSITVKGAAEYHPSVTDPTNVLRYYWSLGAEGITGFTGSCELAYDELDVRLNGHTEDEYVAARLAADGSGDWNKYGILSVDESANIVHIDFTGENSIGIGGDYTAGIDGAIPDQVPAYISYVDGPWTTATTWVTYNPVTNVKGTTPGLNVPAGGPSGAIVYIDHVVTSTGNSIRSYATTINELGTLVINNTTLHRLGIVNGKGTLSTYRAELPAGDYQEFFKTTGGTLDFNGVSNITILADYPEVNNLTLSGSARRTTPNSEVTVRGKLTIAGATLYNTTYDQTINVKGNVVFNSGAFTAGNTSASVFRLNGTSQQSVEGLLGFTSANKMQHLEISNAAGAIIKNPLEINGDLYLTNGLLSTTQTNILTMLTNSSVIYGGGSQSFVNGPMKKNLLSGASFTFPIGGSNRYGLLGLQDVSAAGIWEVEYINNNPGANSPSLDPNSMVAPIEYVSHNEFWRIKAPVAANANLTLRWDASSGINNLSTLRVVEWKDLATDAWQSISIGAPSGTIMTGNVSTNSLLSFNKFANGNYFTFGSEYIPIYVWSGALSSDWFNTGNWTENGSPVAVIPMAGSNVTIPDVTNDPLISGASLAQVNELVLNSGVVLTLNEGGKFTVNGSMNYNGDAGVTSGLLHLKHSSTSPSSFIHYGSVIGNSNVRVDQTFTGAKRKWYVGHVVDGANFNDVALPSTDFAMYYYNTPIASANNWVRITSSSTVTEKAVGVPLKGYGVQFLAETETVTHSGALFDNATPMLTYSMPKVGFQLLANPYPSYVDLDSWTSQWDFSKVDKSIWMYTDAPNNQRVYATYNLPAGVGTGTGNYGLTRYVAPLQAFWVKCSTVGDFGIKPGARTHGTGGSLKAAALRDDVLRIQLQNSLIADETVIVFREIGNTTYSSDFDSEKRIEANAAIAFVFSLKGGKQVAINLMPEDPTTHIVPLGMTVGTAGAGTLKLKASNIVDFMPDMDVFLLDKVTGETTNLREKPEYTFTSTAVTNQNRFELSFAPIAEVPEVPTEVGNTLGNGAKITAIGLDNKAIVKVKDASFNGNVTIEVLDALGRLHGRTVSQTERSEVEAPSNTQFYIVKVTYKNRVETFKIVTKMD